MATRARRERPLDAAHLPALVRLVRWKLVPASGERATVTRARPGSTATAPRAQQPRAHLRRLVATIPRSRRWRVTQLGHAVMRAAIQLREEHFPAAFRKAADA